MYKTFVFTICISLVILLVQCDSGETKNSSTSKEDSEVRKSEKINLLTDISPLLDDGDINAVIEIPAGTLDKWELNKSSGEISWEKLGNKPRVINYIGYPGNYGMIPRTLLSKAKGGDGDPLDILVLGPPAERGSVVKCKLLGILYLKDRGEQDDKLIAVSSNSPMYGVDSIDELNNNYRGVTEIIELWFTNYKGENKMKSNGFGNKKVAMDVLANAIREYQIES